MEKNKFWKFIFSFVPGAGHMYLGMMKKGVVLMLGFLGLMGIAATMALSFLLCILPAIWFYAFFDTHNMGRLDLEARLEKDKEFYDGILRLCDGSLTGFMQKRRKLVGILCMFFALYAFIYGVLMPLFSWGNRFWIVSRILGVMPTIVVVVFLFKFGQYFLKKEQDEDFTAYKKEEDEVDTPKNQKQEE